MRQMGYRTVDIDTLIEYLETQSTDAGDGI